MQDRALTATTSIKHQIKSNKVQTSNTSQAQQASAFIPSQTQQQSISGYKLSSGKYQMQIDQYIKKGVITPGVCLLGNQPLRIIIFGLAPNSKGV